MSLRLLADAFWSGGRMVGKWCLYHENHYVDEVDNSVWMYHGTRLAEHDGRHLTLYGPDIGGDGVAKRIDAILGARCKRVRIVETDAGVRFETKYLEASASMGLVLVARTPVFPVEVYRLSSPLIIDAETCAVVRGPRPLYLLPTPKDKDVSVLPGMLMIRTTVGADTLRSIYGIDLGSPSGMVYLAVLVKFMRVFARPSISYSPDNLWYELRADELRAVLESMPEGDRRLIEEVMSDPQKAETILELYKSIGR